MKIGLLEIELCHAKVMIKCLILEIFKLLMPFFALYQTRILAQGSKPFSTKRARQVKRRASKKNFGTCPLSSDPPPPIVL